MIELPQARLGVAKLGIAAFLFQGLLLGPGCVHIEDGDGQRRDLMNPGRDSVRREAACVLRGECPRRYRSLSLGANHSCGLLMGMGYHCWGNNQYGQLGIGKRQVEGASDLLDSLGRFWKVISAYGGHSCGIDADNMIFCWGKSVWGQDQGLASSDQGELARTSAWQKVSVGGMVACGVTKDGNLYCWRGLEASSQGRGEAQTIPTGLFRLGVGHEWTTLSVGGGHACLMNSARRLFCWGRGHDGEISLGRTGRIPHHEPKPILLAAKMSWKRVSAGGRHSCAISDDGKLYCWGQNRYGQLGRETGDRFESRMVPTEHPGGKKWSLVDAGLRHSCAIDEARVLYCWGSNRAGQLGIGGAVSSKSEKRKPEPVKSPERWLLVAVGSYHSCAINTDQELFCWGYNGSGQTGHPRSRRYFSRPTKARPYPMPRSPGPN